MTQGNCRRLAVGTGPTRLTRGAPAPRPALRLLPGAPPTSPASLRAPAHTLPRRPPRVPSENRFPEDREARGQAEEGSSAGRPGRGRRTHVGRMGRGAPWPWPSSPPWRRGTAARLRWELCPFPSNYLSEPRPEGARRKGRPPAPEGLPIRTRGTLWVTEGWSPVSSLPSSLFCSIYSRIRTNLCCPPSHLGVCGVDTQRTQ